jgi:hypothetical protein
MRSAFPRGLILYIQDLELMDFGDVALEILTEAWEKVREMKNFRIHFVTPDEYLEETRVHQRRLPTVRFERISWAPEIRLVLRSDGHYPPLNAGAFRGVDAMAEIFPRRPFIFWETEKYLKKLYPECIPDPQLTTDWLYYIEGLCRLLEVLIDTRIGYLSFGLACQRDELQFDPDEALRELDYARDFQGKAEQRAISVKEMIELKKYFDKPPVFWEQFLIRLREYCLDTFLSLDHIQRAWGKGGNVEFLVEAMYKYLYDLYPPKCPEIMDEIESKGKEGRQTI